MSWGSEGAPGTLAIPRRRVAVGSGLHEEDDVALEIRLDTNGSAVA